MKKKILFRADGNSVVGLGHLYRLFALAELYKVNYDFIFVTREDSALKVFKKEYSIKIIPKTISLKSEADWLAKYFNPENHIIIADGYQFVSAYQKCIKEKGFFLMYIDDLTTEYMYADIVVNHSPGVNQSDFKSESYTQFVLGTNYAMLRPTFLGAAREKRTINKIESAFVCFGGVDLYDLSIKAAKSLLKFEELLEINIVLGEGYLHKEINILANNNDKLLLHKNLNEEALCSLMKSCQIAIASSSTILYEICSVKMPVLSGFYIENQKNIYKELAKQEVIVEGGDFTKLTVFNFEEKIKTILESSQINSYIQNQHKLFDGKSRLRFLGLLNSLNISFRKATKNDLLQVYNWSNNTLVRENSYNSMPLKLKDHSKWFLDIIKSKDTLFLIAMVNNHPAGIVRYTIKNGYSVVGIIVSEEYRGQKLASKFLLKGANKYFEKFETPILAFIKKENTASVKSFQKANYKYFKDEIINGSSSFVYKLNKSNDLG